MTKFIFLALPDMAGPQQIATITVGLNSPFPKQPKK